MVRVAFVGCGAVMESHYRHLGSFPNVKIVGHCDVEMGRAKSAAERFGGEPFVDFSQMYEKVKPRAVYVGVPAFAHGPMEEAAAERGIHLFIEPPLALDRGMAQRIALSVAKSKIVASVGYRYRYCEMVGLARKLLKGKAVSLVRGYCHGGLPGSEWGRRPDQGGGQLVEQMTHLFDLVRYLCGEVAEVHGMASRGCMMKLAENGVDDSSVVVFRLKSGAVASLTSTCILDHEGGMGLEIVTPEATLTYGPGRLRVLERDKCTEYRTLSDGYTEEDAGFIEAVRTDKRVHVRSLYGDALKTFWVSLGARLSLESGLPTKP